MKKIYISLSFVLVCSLLMAQNKNTKAADKLFNRYEFVAAADAYLKLANNNKGNSYVFKQLADSYYNIFNTEQAVKWYAKAIEKKGVAIKTSAEGLKKDAEMFFRYAQMLKANGNYAESDKQMKQFATLAPNDKRAIDFLNNLNYLEILNNQEKLFDTKDFNINSDKSDFGAYLADNTLYFASARNEGGKKFAWNKEPYLDIYAANYKGDGTFDNPNLVPELNSKYNDGPATLSKDGNTIYFASESFKEKVFLKDKTKKTKYGMVSLYKAIKKNGKWDDFESLPFNGKNYSTSNPSLSKDGKTLYFSSNMPGSLGYTDIWKVAIDENGKFGTPENLGPTINTEGRESFPYITDENLLYFASDAHNGYGGYDVFVTDLNKSEPVKNLGKPVNSSKDDFSFSYNNTKKLGFFASNRNGQDDIFVINQICGKRFILKISNAKTGELISEALVTIIEDNKKIEEQTSNAQGTASTQLACDKEHAIVVTKAGFENYSEPIKKGNEQGDVVIEIPMTPIEPVITETEILLQDIYFEFDKSNITQQGAAELNKLVSIMKERTSMEIAVKSHTDSKGSDQYNKNLSERRAKSTAEYVISKGIDRSRITAKGYGESEPKVNCIKCTKAEDAKNRRSEFMITKK